MRVAGINLVSFTVQICIFKWKWGARRSLPTAFWRRHYWHL